MQRFIRITFIFILFPYIYLYAENITSKYEENLHSINLDFLKDKKVYFIPGILHETVIRDSNQPVRLTFLFGEYFNDQVSFLKKHGIDAELIILESEDSVANNSKRLKEKLNANDYFVVTHSKGGLEFLDFLLNNPEQAVKVNGWISFQSPFYGSNLALMISKNSFMRRLSSFIFDFFGGSLDGVNSLLPKVRNEYMVNHRDAIQDILSKINYVNFVSKLTPNDAGILKFSAQDLQNCCGDNDGLVEISNAKIPNTDFVFVENLSHLDLILNMKSFLKRDINFDRQKNISAMLMLLK